MDPDYSIGGALDSQYYSVEGAFNGSGIALARVSFDENDRGLVDMYFQHWTGDLRWSQLMSDGSWQGGSSSETLTEDARNGTPIAAVAYATEEQAIWHIFYIDLNNTLREKINSNTTNVWREGPLTKKNLKANQADRVALQACWFSNSFGDDTFQENNVQNVVGGTPIGDIGIRLWYGRSDTTLEQLGWLYGEVSISLCM